MRFCKDILSFQKSPLKATKMLTPRLNHVLEIPVSRSLTLKGLATEKNIRENAVENMLESSPSKILKNTAEIPNEMFQTWSNQLSEMNSTQLISEENPTKAHYFRSSTFSQDSAPLKIPMP